MVKEKVPLESPGLLTYRWRKASAAEALEFLCKYDLSKDHMFKDTFFGQVLWLRYGLGSLDLPYWWSKARVHDTTKLICQLYKEKR